MLRLKSTWTLAPTAVHRSRLSITLDLVASPCGRRGRSVTLPGPGGTSVDNYLFGIEGIASARPSCSTGTWRVRFGSKADMCSAKSHVRFTLESGPLRCWPLY